VRGPYGLAGGQAGATGRNTLVRKNSSTRMPGKTRFDVNPGDVLRIESPGGGGYGRARVTLPLS